MMVAAKLPTDLSPENTGPVVQHLRDGDEVMRCAAARALAVLGGNEAAAALVEALLDEDPDVRTDAMGALVRCARPEDADAIRRSLLGDPIKEVKLAAIEALARLEDRTSIPLLAALAKDRCDHDVAWEDEAGMWDDWLDIQVAAIEALGLLKAADCVDDLLAARDDEMGQELNDVVFAALAAIPGKGIASLLKLLHDEMPRVREQAFIALAKAQPKALEPVMELLLQDASPDVRGLAVQNLASDDSSLERILREDPAASVRLAALQRLGIQRPDFALTALQDVDESVRAAALDLLLSDPAATVPEDLGANVQAWLTTSGPVLAAASAGHLPCLCGSAANAPLQEIALELDRSLEVRIAALRALMQTPAPEVVATLEAAIMDPARQIRAAALLTLVSFTESGDAALAEPARDLLAAAIAGHLTSVADRNKDNDAQLSESLSASKVEDEGRARIRISREGDILTDRPGAPDEDAPDKEAPNKDAESNVVNLQFPTSTLAAIQADAEIQIPEETPSEKRLESPRAGDRSYQGQTEPLVRGQGKYRRRVAVDGPDDIVLDLQLVGLPIAASCAGEEIEAALCAAASSATDAVRSAAFAAIQRRSETESLSPVVLSVLMAGLEDENALIRGAAVQAAGNCGQVARDSLLPLIDDQDPVVRAAALKSLCGSLGETKFDALKDPSALVRRTAFQMLLDSDTTAELERGLQICLDCGWADSLTEFCRKSPEARNLLLAELHDRALGRKQTLTVLEAVGAAA